MKANVCILLFLVSVSSCEGLECAIVLKQSFKDLNQVITTCMIPTIPTVEVKVDNVTKVDSEYDEPEDIPTYGPRRGLQPRTKRQDESSLDETTEKVSTTTKATTTSTTSTTKKPDDINEAKRCVVRCIMEHYNMLDERNKPDFKKVSEALQNNEANREIKDVLQDSVDDCFFQMTETSDLDSCGKAAKLVTCMADKGRQNCADWPVGELPFPHKI